MLANPGEAVENMGKESRKWATMAEVFFFELLRVKTVDTSENTQLA
jgi:hypothetical protein